MLAVLFASLFQGATPAFGNLGLSIALIETPSVNRTWADFSLLYEDQYHSPSQLQAEIQRFETLVPSLVETMVIGQSYEGRNITCLRITNELNEEQKAKTLVLAQHHGREQITVEMALRFALRLMNSYGVDDEITQYVDTEEIYIIPSMNPDALERVVNLNDYWLRKNLRPYDNDGDGLLDEDPADDANGDGVISSYDVYAKSDGGSILTYLYSYFEGIDDDDDGRINCDEIGLVDLNRNYARSWGLEPGSSSDPWSQVYHGAYAFSEPETQAFRDFALQHRFAISYTLHSGTNATYFPLTSYGAYTEPTLYYAVLQDLAGMLPPAFYSDQGRSSSFLTFTRAQKPMIETGCGMWEDWMYADRGTKVPITFELYHNTAVDMDEAFTLIVDNSTHYIEEWHDIFGYFDPVTESIESLWTDIMPVFDYLLEMTPRLSIVSKSVAGGTNQGDTVTASLGVECLSPRLGSSDEIEVAMMDGTRLCLLSVASPHATTQMQGSFQLPVDLTVTNYTIRLGNNYTGYTRLIISANSQSADGGLFVASGVAVAAGGTLVLAVLLSRHRGKTATTRQVLAP